MSVHIDTPDDSREDPADDWRARWNERLREAAASASAEEATGGHSSGGGEAADPPMPAVSRPTPGPETPTGDLPSLNIDAPEAFEARRRIESDVERARAEMEALVRQAAALEAAEAVSAAESESAPESASPASADVQPNVAPVDSEQMAAAEQALTRLSETIAAAEAATTRANEAASRADAATDRAVQALERAEAATTKAEEIAARASQVSQEAEQAVDAAEAKLGEILDALLLDLRQIGDRLSE